MNNIIHGIVGGLVFIVLLQSYSIDELEQNHNDMKRIIYNMQQEIREIKK